MKIKSSPEAVLLLSILDRAFNDYYAYKLGNRSVSARMSGKVVKDWIEKASGTFPLIATAADSDVDAFKELCLSKIEEINGTVEIIKTFSNIESFEKTVKKARTSFDKISIRDKHAKKRLAIIKSLISEMEEKAKEIEEERKKVNSKGGTRGGK